MVYEAAAAPLPFPAEYPCAAARDCRARSRENASHDTTEKGTMKLLIARYAKMFAGGIAAGAAQGVNWALAFIPTTPPLHVGDEFTGWLTAALVAVAVALVPNGG